MPTYPTTRTYESGFFNSHNVNGTNDRVYNAVQMREPYRGIFTDGVKPNDNGVLGTDLAVSAVSGMQISVGVGRGMFGGAFFNNKSAYRITLDSSGIADRYDLVIICADDSESVRESTIYIKSQSTVPTLANLVRTTDKKEYCIGYVKVAALATSVTQANITDTRLTNMCGIITGVFNQVDTNALYIQWQTAFDTWLASVQDDFVANATLVRTYFNTYHSTTANQRSIPIGVPQYNRFTDVLIVIVNGRIFTENVNYTITSNTYINLSIGLPVIGTKVQFQVLKSVDGSDAETVISEVAALTTQMNTVNVMIENHYYCNGETDNILISDICNTYLRGGTDYGSMRLVIHGNPGVTTQYQMDGSAYIWFRVGDNVRRNRRVILDFTDSGQLIVPCVAGATNTIFYGLQADIRGVHLTANGGGSTYIFSQLDTPDINAEKCRFVFTASTAACVALTGTFTDCYVYATVTSGNCNCFGARNSSVLRLRGGEYCAFAGTGYSSYVVYVAASYTTAIVITYGISCPTIARSGLVQSASIQCLSNSAKCSFTDTITALPLSATGQNIRGTIALSRPRMLG